MELKMKVSLYLIAVGASIVASPLVIGHYASVSDGISGIISGTGMGMLITALLYIAKQKKKPLKAG